MKREQDIEKLLQKAADEKQVEGLSERWKNLKKSLMEEDAESVEYGEVLCKKKNKYRYAFWVAVPLLCACVALAIVLPLSLQRTIPVVEYFSDELVVQPCTSEDFYQTFEDLNQEMISVSSFEQDNHSLLVTQKEAIVKGGKIDLTGYNADEIDCYAFITFYDENVTILERNFVVMENIVNVNGTAVEYTLTEKTDGELYSYLSWATYKGYTYKIEYSSTTDNIESFLTEIFS